MIKSAPLDIVILGLSITSSWGNGHATTYRALVRELEKLGHRVLFLERDVPWYAAARDLPVPPWGQTALYTSRADLEERFTEVVRRADVVVVGSYVPEGIEVAWWVFDTAQGVTAFYDIDTPVTLEGLERGECEYLHHQAIPRFDLYLSFTGGPLLQHLESTHGARAARPLYCSVDPQHYHPEVMRPRFDLGYMGTYSADRQPPLEELLLAPARRRADGAFAVVGSGYPVEVTWPVNVARCDHLPPQRHVEFYNAQRFTLNVTRAAMRRSGWAPSVRLFEAAACGTPIISDNWPGLEAFFDLGTEILVAETQEDVLSYLTDIDEKERRALGRRARRRALAEHTAATRARQLEQFVGEAQWLRRHSA